MPPSSQGHFSGKSVKEHLLDARKKGLNASEALHSPHVSSSLFHTLESVKDIAILFLILSMVAVFFPLSIPIILLILLLYTAWKSASVALLGWGQLERLHRLIQEEKWEIEHHRKEEKEELREMYRAKGFSGKLLEDVVQVLMAEDNRLLKVMLEEELGLRLESIEHPLKQALFSLLGSFIALGILSASLLSSSWMMRGTTSLLLVALSAFWMAYKEKNHRVPAVVWYLAVGLIVGAFSYTLAQFLWLSPR